MRNPYKFNSNSKQNEIPQNEISNIFKKYSNGDIVNKDEQQNSFDQCYSNKGIFKIAGWAFDFRQFWKRYVIIFNYGDIEQIYAPSKSSIRKNNYIKDISEIHEIPRNNIKA